MGELKSSQWKYERAAEIQKRRTAANPDPLHTALQRGNVPLYHTGFYYYLRWILGALPPLQDVPTYWTEEEGESYNDHVRYFGRPKETYEVVTFLRELFDQTFYQIFGCRADLEDYIYVAETVARAGTKLETIPAPMNIASSWLNEQIEWMQAARFKESRLTEQAALNADSATDEVAECHSSHEILMTTDVFTAKHVAAEQIGATEDAQIYPSDPWEGLFRNYTLAKLNNLLIFVGLLDTASPVTIAEYTRPGQWAAVISALIKAKRVKSNRAKVGEAFYKAYGDETASLSTYQKPHQKSFNDLYNNALSRIMCD